MTNPIDAAQAKRDTAESDAAEQSAEYGGIETVYTTQTGETFPYYDLSLLDDEQQERFELVQFTFQQCDKAPPVEIPERTIESSDGKKIHYPARQVDGGFLTPYRKDGVLVTPPYNPQFTEAMLGEDAFQKFKAAKGKSSEYVRGATKFNEALAERAKTDSKSASGSGDLAPVSD